MKIGIVHKPYDKRGYVRFGDKCFRKIREHGFEAIDYNLADTQTEIFATSMQQAARMLAEESQKINDAGLFVSQIHGPWRWPARDVSAEDRAERRDKMIRSMEMGLLLNCKNWVIHPIMPYGHEEAGLIYADRTWDANMEFMTSLLQTAKTMHVTICLENLPMLNYSMATVEAVLKFVNEINDDHFRICLDTGHAAIYKGAQIGDAVRMLGSKIRVLHVHDSWGQFDLHLPPYMGAIDWEDFGQSLSEIQFKGVLSLETSPSGKLSDELFDKTGLLLYKYARQIVATSKL